MEDGGWRKGWRRSQWTTWTTASRLSPSLSTLFSFLFVCSVMCSRRTNRLDNSWWSRKRPGNKPSLTSYMQTLENVKPFPNVTLMASGKSYDLNLLYNFPRRGLRDVSNKRTNSDIFVQTRRERWTQLFNSSTFSNV